MPNVAANNPIEKSLNMVRILFRMKWELRKAVRMRDFATKNYRQRETQRHINRQMTSALARQVRSAKRVCEHAAVI